MDQNTINTVIVLRNDQTTVWEESGVVMLKGEVGIGYLDNGNVIAKLGDGQHSWKDLPQIEGVFETDQILTYNFGRHKTVNGKVNAGGKGMTTSEWLLDALSESLDPKTNYPTASLAAGTNLSGHIKNGKINEIISRGYLSPNEVIRTLDTINVFAGKDPKFFLYDSVEKKGIGILKYQNHSRTVEANYGKDVQEFIIPDDCVVFAKDNKQYLLFNEKQNTLQRGSIIDFMTNQQLADWLKSKIQPCLRRLRCIHLLQLRCQSSR